MLDTTLLVALGGGAGVALLLREVISVVAALRNGVSAREGKRRADIEKVLRDFDVPLLEEEGNKLLDAPSP